MEQIIILSNIGSASKKYSVYRGDFEVAWFHFEKKSEDFLLSFKINNSFEKKHVVENQYKEALIYVYESLSEARVISKKEDVSVLGLRIVVPHEDFVLDKICTKEILDNLKSIQEIDPLHINPALDEITISQKFFGESLPIYFISDSSFHATNRKKIPLMFKNPVYTIGYHGLSCESVISFLKKDEVEHSKLIIAHLGGGSSITAIKNSVSVYNSMEFSPLDGVLMTSRSGSIDPFAILLYMRENNLSYEQTLDHLYSKSGIYALSEGISNDLRVIREEAFKGNKDAKYAINQYVDSIVSHICEAASYTQGIDTLVFSGTIGYRAGYIREMVVEKLSWLGLIMNHSKNLESNDLFFDISSYDSKVKIFAAQVDEMKEMHKHVKKIFKK